MKNSNIVILNCISVEQINQRKLVKDGASADDLAKDFQSLRKSFSFVVILIFSPPGGVIESHVTCSDGQHVSVARSSDET